MLEIEGARCGHFSRLRALRRVLRRSADGHRRGRDVGGLCRGGAGRALWSLARPLGKDPRDRRCRSVRAAGAVYRGPHWEWTLTAVRLAVDLGLLAIVLVSIAVGRPFTIQYARERIADSIGKRRFFLPLIAALPGYGPPPSPFWWQPTLLPYFFRSRPGSTEWSRPRRSSTRLPSPPAIRKRRARRQGCNARRNASTGHASVSERVTIVVDQAPELRAVALGSADMYVAENLPAAGLGQLPRFGRGAGSPLTRALAVAIPSPSADRVPRAPSHVAFGVEPPRSELGQEGLVSAHPPRSRSLRRRSAN